MAIVPNLRSVALLTTAAGWSQEYALFNDFRQFTSVLPVYGYEQPSSLLLALLIRRSRKPRRFSRRHWDGSLGTSSTLASLAAPDAQSCA